VRWKCRYQLFHAGEVPATVRKIKVDDNGNFGATLRGRTYLLALHKALSEMKDADRNLVLHVAKRVSKR
jgi:hypothetical protein